METRGEEWLREHPEVGLTGEDLQARQRDIDSVERLIALARLKRVLKEPGIVALKLFQRQYQHQGARFSGLVREAWLEEAKRSYQAIREQRDVLLHQRFRREYPQSPYEDDSRGRELDVAWERARQENTLRGYQQLSTNYRGWSELERLQAALTQATASAWYREVTTAPQQESAAAHHLFLERFPDALERATSRARLVTLAFQEAKIPKKERPLLEFQARYAEWSEAAQLVAEAYPLAAAYALEEAERSGELDALIPLKERYREPVWQERIETLEVKMAAQPLSETLERGENPDDASLSRFLGSYLRHPRLQTLRPSLSPLIDQAFTSRGPSLWLSRLARQLDPEHPAQQARYEWEAQRAWELSTDRHHGLRSLQDYLTWYPTGPEAPRADALIEKERLIKRATRAWPRVSVQRVKRDKNHLDLLLNVTDCTSQGPRYVSGVDPSQLKLIRGDELLSPSRFKGIEDDRPLDVVFGVDLSGSMDVERDAVDQAVLGFVERLSFRRRVARVGLVAFGDVLYAQHPPEGSTAHFKEWMSKLPKSFGGQGEDAMQAMWRAAQMMRQANTERVNVMITDEQLQVNQEGLKSLKVELPKECVHIKKSHGCLARCLGGAQQKTCISACIPKLPGDYQAPYKTCLKSYRARVPAKHLKDLCVNSISWGQVLHQMSVCTRNVHEDSPEFKALVEDLSKRDIRPIFIIPREADTGSFSALSRALQGQLSFVPQDATEPTPYIEVLEQLSEQLSTQYEARYPQAALGSAALTAPQLVVEEKTRWRAQRETPGDLNELIAQGDELCPTLLSVSATGDVKISEGQAEGDAGCEVKSWRALGALRAPLKQALTAGGAPWLLTREGEVLRLRLQPEPELIAALELPQVELLSEHAGALHALSAADPTTGARRLFRLLEARWVGLPELPALPSEAAASSQRPLLLNDRDHAGEKLCAQQTHEHLSCLYGERWVQERSVGLPAEALSPRARLLSAPQRPEVSLLSTEAGKLYRSHNGGRVWREVSSLPTPSSPWALLSTRGKRPLLCASSEAHVWCSADHALTWRDMSAHEPPLGAATSALAVVGRQLWLAYNGQARRLERVVNRDIPSSALYFQTDKDAVLPALKPFLNEIASRLLQEGELFLRVEGHADQRGDKAYNRDLAQRRAQNVARELLLSGVPEERVEVVSFGEERPLRPGASAHALSLNRRVELILTEPMSTSSEERAWSACALER